MIEAGIVGGTGYAGVELLRLLAGHPEVNLKVITSRGEAGTHVAELFPNLRGLVDLTFTEPDSGVLASCDLVFFATPHGVAQAQSADLVSRGVRVIDLSADFRIRDVPTWEKWYGQAHGCPELLDEAVYGLPEINREAIRDARLVACPGCYPTGILLGFLPLLEKNLVDPADLVASCASGTTGAGRQAKIDTLFAEVNDSFKAYAVDGHRHLPEIEQALTDMAGGPVAVTFVPHMLPITRGLHSSLYANLVDVDVDLQRLYEARYADEPFVDVMPPGVAPQTRSVRGSNFCRIGVYRPQGRDKAVILTAEDNLVKGASGQAIQNMNLMFGLEETLGIDGVGLLP